MLVAAVTAPMMLAYWIGLFVTCRPALDLFCLGPLLPWAFAAAWLVVAAGGETVARRADLRGGRLAWRWIGLVVVSLFLAIYSCIRADNDVFALAAGREVAAAGGAEQVRREWQVWHAQLVSEHGEESPSAQLPFYDAADGGVLNLKAPADVPAGLGRLHARLGGAMTSANQGVLHLRGRAGLNDYQVLIYPPGDAPDWEFRPWGWLAGGWRELDDGVWLQVTVVNK